LIWVRSAGRFPQCYAVPPRSCPACGAGVFPALISPQKFRFLAEFFHLPLAFFLALRYIYVDEYKVPEKAFNNSQLNR
jgi:hypothetical protein